MSRVAPDRPAHFAFERDGEPQAGMVIGDGRGRFAVFVNRCPHVPYSLDLGDGNVIDSDGKTIVCSNHGARFEPDSGKCIWGPVRGRYLERLPFERDGSGSILVTIVPEPSTWPQTYTPD